jgi:hypothetical protein
MAQFSESSAEMIIGYPKRFHLSGLVELEYRNFNFKITSDGQNYSHEQSTFGQLYELNLDGYIYHPRLIVFNSGISFGLFNSISGGTIKSKGLGYFFSTTFLPYRPISLELFGSREQYHFDVSSRTSALIPDRTTDHYGAKLRIDIVKFQPIRAIRINYEHWNYTTEGITKKYTNDNFTFGFRGILTSIRTSYSLWSGLYKSSNSQGDIDNKYISLYTNTAIKANWPTLITNFIYSDMQYSGGEYEKELSFSADLDFPFQERFNHSYSYSNNNTERLFKGSIIAGTEDRLSKEGSNSFMGTWSYRFTKRFINTLTLYYGTQKVDDSSWNIQGLSTSFTYRRPLAGLNTLSRYRFVIKKDEHRGDFTEHSVDLSLTTKEFRWGTAYLNYIFLKSNSDDKVFNESTGDEFEGDANTEIGKKTADSTSHTIVTGLRGRGFGKAFARAIWIIEAYYFQMNSDIKRPIRNFDDELLSQTETEKITKKADQYTLLGQFFIPIRGNLTLNLRSRYTFGKIEQITNESIFSIIDGEKSKPVNMKRLELDARINYIIFRNFYLTALFRGKWDNIDGSPDTTTYDYEAELNYRRGQFLATLELLFSDVEEGNVSYQTRRINLKVRRTF